MQNGAAPCVHIISLDSSLPSCLTELQKLEALFSRNPALIGLEIWIKGEFAPVQEELCSLLKKLALTHFCLRIETLTKQNLNQVFEAISQKNWQFLGFDVPLKKASRSALFQALAKCQKISSLFLANIPLKRNEFDLLFNTINMPPLESLTSLTVIHCNLNNRQVTRLLSQANTKGIKFLDLSWNNMSHVEPSLEYPTFCQTLAQSNLSGLALSQLNFNDEQAKILAQALKKVVQKFEFSFCLSLDLTEVGLDHIIAAARDNPNLTLTMLDPLDLIENFAEKLSKVRDIKLQYQQNKTLIARALEVTAQHAQALPIETLPQDLLEALPPQTYLQQRAISTLNENASLDETTSKSNALLAIWKKP